MNLFRPTGLKSSLLKQVYRVALLLICIVPASTVSASDDFPQCVAKQNGDQANGCSCATITLPADSQGLWEPEFSPDGLRLYFSNRPFGPQTDLFVITRNNDTEPFAAQTAAKLPPAINSERSDRGVNVIRGTDGSDHIFFVSERESAGRIYEASIPIAAGKPVLPPSVTVHRLQGSVDQTTVLNLYVYPDESIMIFNGPGVCTARFTVARKTDEHTWDVDPTANQMVQQINQWADNKDGEEPCGWPCSGSCGLLDPHVTADGEALYFVRAGDIYRARRDAQTGAFLGSTVTQITAIEERVCPHRNRQELWVEGPTTYLDSAGDLWLLYHSASLLGRIGAYRWPTLPDRSRLWLPLIIRYQLPVAHAPAGAQRAMGTSLWWQRFPC